MLILTRRIGEAIIISDNITIQVLAINRGVVRLGIAAPTEIKIQREENADPNGEPDEHL